MLLYNTMNFDAIANLYEKVSNTSKRSDKIYLLGQFLKQYTTPANYQQIALLIQGRAFESHENITLGISSQYVIKALATATGYSKTEITQLWNELGDLGDVAQTVCEKKRQQTLFSQPLTVSHFLDTLHALAKNSGSDSVSRKTKLIADILADATPLEAKYAIRFILEIMRTGIGEGTIRDALCYAFFPKVRFVHTFNPELKTFIPTIDGFSLAKLDSASKISPDNTITTPAELEQQYAEVTHSKLTILNIPAETDFSLTDSIGNYDFLWCENEQIAKAIYAQFLGAIQFALDRTNSISLVLKSVCAKSYTELYSYTPQFQKPIKVMLAQKATSISHAAQLLPFPILAEYKYDGFRMQIHKQSDQVQIFTRRLEDVTEQFPEVREFILQHISATECILDCEAVGYEPQTKKYRPFQHISQRIRRKYDILALAKELPVEVNVFDIIMVEGEDVTTQPLSQRRELLQSILHSTPLQINISQAKLCESEEDLQSFYVESLAAGNEGIMVKALDAPYKPGSRVGTMIKVKPLMDTLDLVITKATWGEGKRATWLTSYTVSCITEEGDLLEVGKVSSGLKEKEAAPIADSPENTTQIQTIETFSELTEQLKALIISQNGKEVILKPEVVIEVAYEEIQKSTSYSSGFALRFPRIIIIRHARSVESASTLEQVEGYYYDQHK